MPFIFTRMVSRTVDEKTNQKIALEGDVSINLDQIAAVANKDGKSVFLTVAGFPIETTEAYEHVAAFLEELNEEEEANEDEPPAIKIETEQ